MIEKDSEECYDWKPVESEYICEQATEEWREVTGRYICEIKE